MLDNSKIKTYMPKNVKSPILGLVYILIIYGGCKILLYDYSKNQLAENIFFSTMIIGGIVVSIYLLYADFSHSSKLIITDNNISGENKYKIKRNILKFKEISFIRITKNIRVIFLKDKTGNKLSIIFHPEFIPLLKEVLDKSDNLDKIDINYKYFSKINAFSEISQIKPVLDKRLAEIKDKNENA